ncbi:NitT/TauT family transport system substrate-binding protein [Lachnospiraceae bacterium XBB1006]|nr:NitT/TauT family transport system substrate-binding protein [Lachnospiraceae bacterium XBB1006]
MKKRMVALLCIMAVMTTAVFVGCGKEKSIDAKETKENVVKEEPAQETEVRIAALKGPTAMGMVKLMDDAEDGKTETNKYSFTISAAPDEITPSIVQGNVDIAAVPANLAAVLAKKTEGKVQVMAINTLGVLYIVENGDTVKGVGDLKGKTIYASGKGATPEYALNYMLTANGIDPVKDVTIEYKSEHAECVAALAKDKNAVAMLPQPFVTVAQAANENIRVAVDMTKEWEEAAKKEGSFASLCTGVVVVRSEFAKSNPQAVALFLKQYQASVEFTNKNVEEAATLIEKYDIVKAPIAKKAIPYCNITYIDGADMKAKLGGYLENLFNQNPAAVGGEVPGDEFYYVQE